MMYDDCLQLKISDLKRFGYLEPNSTVSGVLVWRSKFNKTEVSISVNTISDYIKIMYSCGGNVQKQVIKLIRVKSNLGKGFYFSFVCSLTTKRCVKLHLYNRVFCHRSSFKGLYENQQYSKEHRALNRFYRDDMLFPKYFDIMTAKHFQPFYKGVPTKKYQRILKKLDGKEALELLRLQAIKL